MPTNEETERYAAWEEAVLSELQSRLVDEPSSIPEDVNRSELYEKYPSSTDAAEFIIASLDLEEKDFESDDDDDYEPDYEDDDDDEDEVDDDEGNTDSDDRAL